MKNKLKWLLPSMALVILLMTNCRKEIEPTVEETEKEKAALATSSCRPIYGRGAGINTTFNGYDPYYYHRKGVRHGSYRLNQKMNILHSAQHTFWATQFFFHGGDGGYMGLQEGAYINGRYQRAAIFSIWQAKGARSFVSGGAARPFSGEGTGYQVLVPFNWRNNVDYEFVLNEWYDETSGTKDEWWILSINWPGGSKYIGAIKVPGHWQWLRPWVGGFVEDWNPSSYRSCADIPYTLSVFLKPVLDNTRAANTITGSSYNIQAPGCPNLCANTVSAYNQGYRVVMQTGL